MFKPVSIQSHKGQYLVEFQSSLSQLELPPLDRCHFIVDAKVAQLFGSQLSHVMSAPSVLLVDANENNKSLEMIPRYVEHLTAKKIRRNHTLIAIGGGIIQDITCFIAAVLLRGVEWWFCPTTLLAQADSCIGSKSSINCGAIKNIVGTFTPPGRIQIFDEFLTTLTQNELCSGIGEMLKVHAIDGPESFAQISVAYDSLFTDSKVMARFIRRSLEIKKEIIELDEFDVGPRNVMNYGHSFGHAIESATNYAIPHGIAVTIGMDMANFVATALGRSARSHFDRMHPTLMKNIGQFSDTSIPLSDFERAIAKDKKNLGQNTLGLILPNESGIPEKTLQDATAEFFGICENYFGQLRHQ